MRVRPKRELILCLVVATATLLPAVCLAQGPADGMGDLGLGNLGLGDMNLGNMGGGGGGGAGNGAGGGGEYRLQ